MKSLPGCRSWQKSRSDSFCAQPPDLRFASLVDMDFAISCPLVRRSRLGAAATKKVQDLHQLLLLIRSCCCLQFTYGLGSRAAYLSGAGPVLRYSPAAEQQAQD